jgi:hypothetical protein
MTKNAAHIAPNAAMARVNRMTFMMRNPLKWLFYGFDNNKSATEWRLRNAQFRFAARSAASARPREQATPVGKV